MLKQADLWVAERVIGPIIAPLLRVSRQSRSAASRLFWFLSALDGLYRASSVLALVVFSLMAVFMLVAASREAERETRSRLGFRLLALSFLMLFVFRGLATGMWNGIEFWILVTAAQYTSVAPMGERNN